MDDVEKLLNTDVDVLWAVLISGFVASIINLVFEKWKTRNRLRAEHEYEQRKKIRGLIADHHGRLLNSAKSFNHRMWNFYRNSHKEWLNRNGDWKTDSYYFHSFVHRFLCVSALIRSFEKEAMFIDARIAEKKDFTLLRYLAALHWCMTDVALFEGIEYDSFDEVDHFFSDTFRKYCDAFNEDPSTFSLDGFVQRIQSDDRLNPVLQYFDSLSREEERLRWDRLIAFHLLLVGFINAFGYKEDRTSLSQMREIASHVKNKQVLMNLKSWLPKHGIRPRKAFKLHWAVRYPRKYRM